MAAVARGPMRAALAALALVLWAGLCGPVGAAEEIQFYDSEIVVRGDGVLDVTETIRARAEGDVIKRGIFRDFPLTFEDAGGNTREVTFDIVEITRDGAPEPYHTARNAKGIRIYIGDADVFLGRGVYTYKIRYTSGRQVRFLSGHTEIYWNVTGNDWVFPIIEARARVHLPQDTPPVRWTAYTGRYGEKGDAFAGEVGADGVLTVRTTRILQGGEGLSVVAEIPEGLVAAPTGAQAFEYWFLDNRRFIFGGAGFLAVLIFYLTAWNAVGRDPPKGTIIPLFHPPKGISPALASYVRNYGWTSGWRAFTAAALSLAVKGNIVFDDSGDKIVFRRTREAASGFVNLPPGEREILKWIDRRGGDVTIDKASGKSLASALTSFKSQVEKENRHRFFKRNLGYFIIGVVMTVIALGLVLVFGNLNESEIGVLFVVGFFGVFFGALIVPMVRSLFSGSGVGKVFSIAVRGFILIFFASTFFSFAQDVLGDLPGGFARTAFGTFAHNSFPFVLIAGFAAMNGLFFYLLRAPTAAGRVIMDQIEGLELYIRTAETERLNMAGAPDLDATQFERLLPYAVALKAEKPWSDAFAAAFARAHPGDDLDSGYRPAWHGGYGWSGSDFSRSIASTVSTAESSFSSSIPAPKSSSSGFSGGGGGGSGGGGGGGGGGGW